LKKTERERTILSVANVYSGAEMTRDPARLVSSTKASEMARVHEEDLDAAHHRRVTGGAHSAPMALTGRDLAHGGRATPTWMKLQR
jgi:hypothetical protein